MLSNIQKLIAATKRQCNTSNLSLSKAKFQFELSPSSLLKTEQLCVATSYEENAADGGYELF